MEIAKVYPASDFVPAALRPWPNRQGWQRPAATGVVGQVVNEARNAQSVWDASYSYAKAAISLANELSPEERAVFCLPKIAAAVALRQELPNDVEGWQILADMSRRWAGADATTPASEIEPFWVDMDWVLSYGRALRAYESFTSNLFLPGSPNVLNAAARASLASILLDNDYARAGQGSEFNFIETPWRQWDAFYHTLAPVDHGSDTDGLMAALGGFTFRALAAGCVEWDRVRMTHLVHVQRMAVFVHDVYNFGKDSDTNDQNYGFWNCGELRFSLFNAKEGAVELKNSVFRSFSKKFKRGHDFPVLSLPREVTGFKATPFELAAAWSAVEYDEE